jgi:hypothetical protein
LRNCDLRNERSNAIDSDPRKPGTCAAHCATALLLAVLGGEPVAPRTGCCLLAGSELVTSQRARQVSIGRRSGRDTGPVELHQAGDD